MVIETLFFEAWGENIPLEISTSDNSGGFLQVGQLSLRKYRPAMALVGEEENWTLQGPGGISLWRGGERATVEAASDGEVPRFQELLFQSGAERILLASGNRLTWQQSGEETRKIWLRGAGKAENGGGFLAQKSEGGMQLLFEEGGSESLEVEDGAPANGPWNVYAVGTDTRLLANHTSVRLFNSEGEMVQESPLNNSVYDEQLFPKSHKIEAIAAESLDSLLIAFTGPDGYGILRLAVR